MHTSQPLLDRIQIDDVQKGGAHFLVDVLVVDHFLHIQQPIALIRIVRAHIRRKSAVLIFDGFAQRLECRR